MCRLFGFRSNVASTAHRSLLEAENSLARQALGHADGWGIGWYQGEDPYLLKAEGGAASDERFDRVTRRLSSHTFLVHVRKATVGRVDQLNCHPFRHGRWMFAHNGTVRGFDRLRGPMLERTSPSLRPLIFGETDSEHLFYYLLSAIERAGLCVGGHKEPAVSALAVALRHATDELYGLADDAGVEAPSLNFLLTNGSTLVAQRAGPGLHLATQKVRCADVETCAAEKLCMRPLRPLKARPGTGFVRRCNHLLVSSEPIGAEDIWEEVPQGHLMALDRDLDLYLFGPAPRFRLPVQV